MTNSAALLLSQLILSAFGVRLFCYHRDRIPQTGAVIVVCNHRSFLDAAILIQSLQQPLRLASHHYMQQMPGLREMAALLGGFPLEHPEQRASFFLRQGTDYLRSRQWVGIFPEGTQPMVQVTPPASVGKLQRGFAHLALRAKVPNLAVLPVAICSLEEQTHWAVPLRWLHWFDPTEPLFDRPGLHPVVIYGRANFLVGRPYWITDKHRQSYGGKEARQMVLSLTRYCETEIAALLGEGCR
ncbi:MAG: 1-acyl-sn-glycerol-3-phosphate acyltransferase [Chloroflexaceae bacterium]|nr:1-acyl-sn-glycerol-3-phosphate acyltransferase [Chloroflexaceae bacterium]